LLGRESQGAFCRSRTTLAAGLEVYRRLYHLARRIAKTVQGVTEDEPSSVLEAES